MQQQLCTTQKILRMCFTQRIRTTIYMQTKHNMHEPKNIIVTKNQYGVMFGAFWWLFRNRLVRERRHRHRHWRRRSVVWWCSSLLGFGFRFSAVSGNIHRNQRDNNGMKCNVYTIDVLLYYIWLHSHCSNKRLYNGLRIFSAKIHRNKHKHNLYA